MIDLSTYCYLMNMTWSFIQTNLIKGESINVISMICRSSIVFKLIYYV